MFLRDIGHVIKALELLNQAEQELLATVNEDCFAFSENIAKIRHHLRKCLVDQSGKEWSND